MADANNDRRLEIRFERSQLGFFLHPGRRGECPIVSRIFSARLKSLGLTSGCLLVSAEEDDGSTHSFAGRPYSGINGFQGLQKLSMLTPPFRLTFEFPGSAPSATPEWWSDDCPNPYENLISSGSFFPLLESDIFFSHRKMQISFHTTGHFTMAKTLGIPGKDFKKRKPVEILYLRGTYYSPLELLMLLDEVFSYQTCMVIAEFVSSTSSIFIIPKEVAQIGSNWQKWHPNEEWRPSIIEVYKFGGDMKKVILKERGDPRVVFNLSFGRLMTDIRGYKGFGKTPPRPKFDQFIPSFRPDVGGRPKMFNIMKGTHEPMDFVDIQPVGFNYKYVEVDGFGTPQLIVTKVPDYQPDKRTREMMQQPSKLLYGPFGWNALCIGMIITSYYPFAPIEMGMELKETPIETGMDLPAETLQVRVFQYHLPPWS